MSRFERIRKFFRKVLRSKTSSGLYYCPKCGGFPRVYSVNWNSWVQCEDCGYTLDLMSKNARYAAETWNRSVENGRVKAMQVRFKDRDKNIESLWLVLGDVYVVRPGNRFVQDRRGSDG